MSCAPCEERQASLLQWANEHVLALAVASAIVSALILASHPKP